MLDHLNPGEDYLMTTRAPKTPAGLGTRGRKFWSTTVRTYELTDSEANVLLEVCRTLDQLDLLAEQVRSDGTMIPGASGQSVLHPGIGEGRAQRIALHRLLASLAIPDEDGSVLASTATMRARKAAQSRWAATGARRGTA